ncbi:MAG TPA: Gfo/Idh/MocA family oxidoreductase, partial [Planctomycetota bacterium]|nr:Gfo/Idh/MocA family oxidoreductase [Planctomycetota bacterium]
MIARKPRRQRGEKVRYAVVGQGYIAQAAILPAFKHAKNSELAALVSDDPVKLRELGRKYDVAGLYDYRQYDQLLWSEEIDAVFIALPNDMHRDFSVRAAEAGVHVLCEKPMALSEEDCEAMIAAAEDHDVRLMIGYRLHFEEANLRAIEIVQNGEIGEPRYFSSCFSMQVEAGNIRVTAARGGGPLWDIGVYCINAARYLFRDEPIEVQAFAENNGEARFAETPEAVAATLRFPGARLASFVCSFG